MADGTVSYTLQESWSSESGGPSTYIHTYYSYEWWDDAKQSTLTSQPDHESVNNWKPGISHYTYDVNGHLTAAIDEVGQRSFRYTSNAQGLILKRDEIDHGVNNLRHDYYYLDGKRIGDVGNDGDVRVDYAQNLATRPEARKENSYKNWQPVSSADFDQNYEPISSGYPAQAPGTYTVRNGDSLQSIALSVWGDSSLWYLLADANGLTGTEQLTAGQVLSIPNKVTNIHNNSGTMRVYNPGEAIGDTSPTLPKAPPPPQSGGGGCGGIGAIFVAIVAIVATVFTAGAALSVIAPELAAAAATAAGTTTALGGIMAAGVSALGGASIAAAVIGGAIGSIVA